jgi:hemin uptake protein HemP
MNQPAQPLRPHQEVPRASGDRTTVPVHNSRDLFGNGTLVFIEHQGERYRLQMTRQGKLILTK